MASSTNSTPIARPAWRWSRTNVISRSATPAKTSGLNRRPLLTGSEPSSPSSTSLASQGRSTTWRSAVSTPWCRTALPGPLTDRGMCPGHWGTTGYSARRRWVRFHQDQRPEASGLRFKCFKQRNCWLLSCAWKNNRTKQPKNIADSRSKVLNKKFNLGGTQPTLLYDFTSSLCGVTQGNPAKHKLGARFAQGWRKCFHELSWYIYIYHLHTVYIYSHTLYVYRLYHQSFSLNMLFVFKEQRFQNMSIQQLQNWEIKLHFSRKLRASPAQAKKCIWVK